MRIVLTLIGLVAVTSCATARQRSPDPLSAGDVVTIRLAPPRDLGARADTTTYPLLVIEAFVGRIAAMRADTLFLTEVGGFDSPLVQPRLPREAELAVVPGGTDVVLRGRASGGGGFLLGLLIAVPVFISLSQWDWLSLGN